MKQRCGLDPNTYCYPEKWCSCHPRNVRDLVKALGVPTKSFAIEVLRIFKQFRKGKF